MESIRDSAQAAPCACKREIPGKKALSAAPAWRGHAVELFPTLELLRQCAARPALDLPVESDAAAWLLRHARAPAVELAAQLRLPWRAAVRLACAFELGRRAACAQRVHRAPIRTPRDAFELAQAALHGRDRETVVALYLDGRHRLIYLHEVSLGTATASLIHPREVFGPALRAKACAVVIAHNHPSGDPEPSAEDHGVTERLLAAGELVGVPLLDHLVIGGANFVSLRGRGAWSAQPGAGRRVRA